MKKVFGFMLGFIFAFGVTAKAQNANIQTVYIYSFIKYIEWPAAAQSGDFVIGVLGGGSIVSSLQKMASTKKAGSRKIVVKKFKTPTDIKTCHILFIPENRIDNFRRALEVVGPAPTLVITEAEGYGKKGSGINFVVKNKKLAFELNKKAVDYHRLKVSNELSRLAIQI